MDLQFPQNFRKKASFAIQLGPWPLRMRRYLPSEAAFMAALILSRTICGQGIGK